MLLTTSIFSKDGLLYLENSPSDFAHRIRKFLVKYKMSMLLQPLHSPDLSLARFPMIEITRKGHGFEVIEAIQAAAMTALNKGIVNIRICILITFCFRTTFTLWITNALLLYVWKLIYLQRFAHKHFNFHFDSLSQSTTAVCKLQLQYEIGSWQLKSVLTI